MKEESIILGGGCFWCIEALFKRIDGVISLISGYAGGNTTNPTYKEVCSGNTKHAEVVNVTFDSEKISLDTILDFFFLAHDATQKNRQGNDVGSQYRSFIGCSEDQREIVETKIKQVPHATTEVQIDPIFYPAESYHQKYYEQNPLHPYCMLVIKPKLKKFLKHLK
ncbi:MAG: peptide-methionine (S)-S-oxide reductase MsrA [Candidatus Woesearchaeota archaeon]